MTNITLNNLSVSDKLDYSEFSDVYTNKSGGLFVPVVIENEHGSFFYGLHDVLNRKKIEVTETHGTPLSFLKYLKKNGYIPITLKNVDFIEKVKE